MNKSKGMAYKSFNDDKDVKINVLHLGIIDLANNLEEYVIVK